MQILNALGDVIDYADILFARSGDYGQTWQSIVGNLKGEVARVMQAEGYIVGYTLAGEGRRAGEGYWSSDGRRIVLALPGNPVSAWLMFHIFGLRIAAHLFGAPVEPRTFRLTLATPFTRRNAERQEYVPARLDESARCSPVPYHGSAHLGALTGTDGFFVVPLGVTMMPARAEVRFLPLGDTTMPAGAEVRFLPPSGSVPASPERKP